MTDRKKVISWLEEELEYYKENIGEVRDYGKTIRGLAHSTTTITPLLIDFVTVRISELKILEAEKDANEVSGRALQEV